MSYTHVSHEEREEISRGLACGESLRTIAGRLGRNPSTLSREIARNGDDAPDQYRARRAERRALRRTAMPKRPRLVDERPELWAEIVVHLREHRWSPEQISHRLREDYPDDVTKHISHEAIYASLYVLPRGHFRTELLSCLRRQHRHRRKRSLVHDRRGQIPHLVSIHERPAEVAERRVPGHWEGDLLVGKGHQSAVGTLVERATRLTILTKLAGADAISACRGFTRTFRMVPEPLRKTLTYDRGKEMTDHERLTADTKIRVFFADPQSPWQRGTNENTNGLLRQFFPKGTDLSTVTQRDLTRVAALLNGRPRKCLQWRTPLEAFTQAQRVALAS
jgi:IS30 family transposase